jgi:hypothetical protein
MPWWESKRYVYRGMNKRVVLGEERGEGGKGKRAVCGERGGGEGAAQQKCTVVRDSLREVHERREGGEKRGWGWGSEEGTRERNKRPRR